LIEKKKGEEKSEPVKEINWKRALPALKSWLGGRRRSSNYALRITGKSGWEKIIP